MKLNAVGVHYRELSEQVRAALAGGCREVALDGVAGHRYIGTALGDVGRIDVRGVPGNDLGAFMDGAEIVVDGTAQDGVGNTMNSGRIVVLGDAGDILGYAMRGGSILVRGSVGYRAGIHMKASGDRQPAIVVGGSACDYAGEYMAGGVLVVLGLGCEGRSPVGEFVGAGMHGGGIYVRGAVEPHQVGAEVQVSAVGEDDWRALARVLDEFRTWTGLPEPPPCREQFVKLAPRTCRPSGSLYSH
jgi:glutamate synthase domain-containing protein 3